MSRRTRNGRALALVAALAITLISPLTAAPARAAGPAFTFTAIPDEDETRLRERFGKVADYLHAKLGVDVRYVPVKSYPAAVTAFRNGEVQLAWFGGLTGVQARRAVPGSQAIAQGAEDAAFVTYFIANTATGIKPGKDLPKEIVGRSFTFGAKTSTSGRLMPEYWLRRAFGKAPEQVFSRVGFSGDHTKTLELVQSGAYDVGAMDYTVWKSEVQAGHVDPAKVIVIWQTPSFQDYQWTIRGDVDATFGKGFAQKVRDALLAMHEPALLDSFKRSRFVKASNDDYANVEQTAQAIGLIDP